MLLMTSSSVEEVGLGFPLESCISRRTTASGALWSYWIKVFAVGGGEFLICNPGPS